MRTTILMLSILLSVMSTLAQPNYTGAYGEYPHCQACYASGSGPTNQIPHPATTVVDFHAEICADCHSWSEAPTYDDWLPAGEHQAIFDGSNLVSGLYLAQLSAGEFMATQKMLLLK